MKQARELYNSVEYKNPNDHACKVIRVAIGNGDEFLRKIEYNECDKVLLSSINARIKVT